MDWLVGRWEGESWVGFTPGQRRTNRSLETVQSKVGGSVLLFEGYHRLKLADKNAKAEDVTTHNAIGRLLYDTKVTRYRFVTCTAREGYGDFEARLAGNGWQWETRSAFGTMRFTITHSDKDEWVEKGEASQDGKIWRQFFGMTLHRVEQ